MCRPVRCWQPLPPRCASDTHAAQMRPSPAALAADPPPFKASVIFPPFRHSGCTRPTTPATACGPRRAPNERPPEGVGGGGREGAGGRGNHARRVTVRDATGGPRLPGGHNVAPPPVRAGGEQRRRGVTGHVYSTYVHFAVAFPRATSRGSCPDLCSCGLHVRRQVRGRSTSHLWSCAALDSPCCRGVLCAVGRPRAQDEGRQ